ncbi:serine/threonine-protein kinase [Streptomyces sp. NPDC059698]|uniref:serine/threonine-protein kinase n=1 Tax=unclassified Streptomyces TaxID=2593676 RepID=UPI000939C9AD|nr:serine/threonine-protein kinase [Streptomyces sp. CB02366]OKJ40922.1 serine/threonine protein kinase [Streptomyces sp. CB02366]WSS57232.1 serine/threonine protein kinase [Streptomyces sp. NBC_01178]
MSEAEQAREPQRDKNGRLLAGRYRLGEVLGRGGMGTVWRADDETLGRTVAVKELRFPSAIDEDEKRRLITRTLREAKAIARIRNNSAVTVYDVVDEDDRPWIVMELIEGKSLAEAIREDGTLTPRRAAEVGLAILDVLRSAHREGILHRDVKPSNVLIAEDGRVVLTDFGIAQVEGDPSVTSTGMLVGAPSYISPERARGHKPGPPADLWSLGGLLYASVEGCPPYDKGSAIATLTAVMTEPLDPPKNAGPLTDVIYGLLERDPEQRLDDAGARALLNAVVNAPDAPAPAPADSTQIMAVPPAPAVDPLVKRTPKPKAAKPPKQSTGPGETGEGARDRLRGALRSVRNAKTPAVAGGAAAGAAAAAGSPAAAAGTPAAPPKPPAPPGTSATGARPAVATASAPGTAKGAAAGAASTTTASPSVPGQRPPYGPASTRASITDVVPRRTLAIIAAVVALAILGTVLALTLGGEDPDNGGKGGTAASAGASSGDADGKGEDTGGGSAGEKGGGQKEGQGTDDGRASADPSGDASGDPKTGGPGDGEGDGPGRGDALPAGYRKITDDRFHFTMAMPEDFKRTGIAGSNSGGIYNVRRGGFPRVQIDFNSSPRDDAAAAWRGAVGSAKLLSDGYKHGSIKKVEYNGYPTVADWTFERSHSGVRVRVLNRGFKVDAGRGYSIMISCRIDAWDDEECRTLRETAFGTFTPTK